MYDNKKLVSWAVVSFSGERDLQKHVSLFCCFFLPQSSLLLSVCVILLPCFLFRVTSNDFEIGYPVAFCLYEYVSATQGVLTISPPRGIVCVFMTPSRVLLGLLPRPSQTLEMFVSELVRVMGIHGMEVIILAARTLARSP